MNIIPGRQKIANIGGSYSFISIADLKKLIKDSEPAFDHLEIRPELDYSNCYYADDMPSVEIYLTGVPK